MNLTDCLKKYDIDPDDVSRIRALQKDFLADGMSPEQAAVNAVETVIGEAEAERNELIDRVVSEGGDIEEYFQEVQVQSDQTQTDAFKKWFGDSKVVDENGKPLVVYHGTGADFSEFDSSFMYSGEGASQTGSGFYFTDNKESASRYALLATEKGQAGRVLPVYLSLQNPLHIDFETGEVSGADIALTRSQVKKIIMSIPNIKSTEDTPLLNFGDIDYEGFNKVLNYAIDQYAGTPAISALRNDFFVDDNAAWLRSFSKATGYDSAYEKTRNGDTHWVAWFPEQIKSAIGNVGTFSPESANILEQQNLGKIQFPPDITEAPSIITLLENADETTFLHESAHFFFQILRHAASQPNANPEDVADLEALNKWFHSQNKNWDGVVRAEQHELVARAFEKYLMTGKAPSLDLQGYFRRFKAWMVRVYRELTGIDRAAGFKVKLTPGVKNVFDRMLATEEQIKEAEIANRYQPLFETAEEMGAERWRAYMNTDHEATEEAKEELTARSMQDMKWLSNAKAREVRKLQLEAAELRKSVRAEVEADLYDEPIYKARRFLTHGEVTERAKVILGAKGVHRLSIPDLKQMYGEDEIWKRLPVGKYGMVGKEGLNPDEFADVFGLKSGDALVRGLIEAPAPKQEIERRTDDEMLKRYGDLTDPAALEQAAQEAIHNKARMRMVSTELAALSKMVKGSDYRVLDKAARAFASDAIDRRKVRDILPGRYRASASKAALAARKAKDKGDIEQAAQDKRAQLLQMHFYRAAVKGRKESEKLVRYLRKFQRGRKNIPSDYLDQIDALLNRFELRRISEKEDKRRKSLAQWAAEKEANGEDVIIDETLLDESRKINHRDLTLGELRELTDSIKNIETLGRWKNGLLTDKERRDFQKLMSDAAKSIKENATRVVPEKPTPTDKAGRIRKGVSRFVADHRKFGSRIREMDGFKDHGILWQLLARPALIAQNLETEMRAEASKVFIELFSKIKIRGVPGDLKAFSYQIPGTNISLNDEQRLMVALNWGNQGNRQRLQDGGLLQARDVSEQEIQAILDTLSQDEWDFVQGVWDHFETYRKAIGEQEKRLTGREPKWLENTPVETKYGTMRGGYFPAKYDTQLSTRSDSLEAGLTLREQMQGAFGNAATRGTYAKDRAKQVKGRPLLLSFTTVTGHVNEVIHRLAWEDWVRDARKIVKALDEPIRKHYGYQAVQDLNDTIKDVAEGDFQPTEGLNWFIHHIRVGSTIVGLGFRFFTAAIQPTGFAQSIFRIGGEWVRDGLKTYLKNPVAASQFAKEKSALMRSRDQTFMREVNEVLNVVKKGKRIAQIEASYFYMIAKMQQTVDVPTWIGAYHKGLAELRYDLAATEEQRKSIETEASLLADQAVKDSQSHGDLLDLARIQRGSPIKKLWTNFYSYFSATYNQNVEAYRRMSVRRNQGDPMAIMKYIGDMAVVNFLPAAIAFAIRELLKPECGNDLECYGQKYVEEQMDFLFGQMVLLREVGAGIDFWSEYQYGYKGPAGMRLLSDVDKAKTQIMQGEFDMAAFKAVNNVLGGVIHYPAGQVNNTVEGVLAVAEGDVEGLGIIGAIMTGPPR